MTREVGINGFGRFGLHLLRYWLDRTDQCEFEIRYVNDEVLSLEEAFEILTNDRYVRFDDVKLERTDRGITVRTRAGAVHEIEYSRAPQPEIPWLGSPLMLFECSGRYTEAANCVPFLRGQTRLVAISATSWDADATLVFGFNQETFDPERHRVVSYGSCTVNAYVPLAAYLNGRYRVIDSDVNVVHNIPEYKLPNHQTLHRKFCTLERSGPNLLDFIDAGRNFVVKYTVVPWTGVSMFDYRFRVEQPPKRDELIADLERAFEDGPLAGLYGIDEVDIGPEVHVGTPRSAVLIREGIEVRGDQLYLPSYFDTENSVNRYFDLVTYLQGRLQAG